MTEANGQDQTGGDKASVDQNGAARNQVAGELSLEDLAKVAGGRVGGGIYVSGTNFAPLSKNQTSAAPKG